MHRLYTYGYSGGSVQDLRNYAAAGALIADIRLSPRSRVPHWNREPLEQLLGNRYRWIKALGNVHYRGDGPILIADLPAGLRLVKTALLQGPVILLCACSDPSTCHRSVVAAAAQRHCEGLEVVHLAPGHGLIELDGPLPSSRMLALTLWQPWASAIPAGVKRVETRSWPAPASAIGKPLAIHAAAKRLTSWERGTYLDSDQLNGKRLDELPYGAVVAIATLAACLPTEDLRAVVSAQELEWGDFSPGRYGWVLEEVQPVDTPIPAKGGQRLWYWDDPR
jgi:activating signal cointegrator 1